MTEVIFLQGFRDANLQCYWNTALYDCFRNLEYKGYIVPSTVLIWALPRFLTTLRTAWSRQMLRSPPGYRIEFIGKTFHVFYFVIFAISPIYLLYKLK